MNQDVAAASVLRGVALTPGDKSISHRAFMLSALANGESTVEGSSNGEDVLATMRIMQQLGATIASENNVHHVVGPSEGLRAALDELNCGNSGTTLRLLCGLVASAPGPHHLTGDRSLCARPTDRVATPLAMMGLPIEGQGPKVFPPLTIVRGTESLRAIVYESPIPSAQVKSAVLFAGLVADGVTVIYEKVRTRTNTEEMLQQTGINVVVTNETGGTKVQVSPGRPNPHSWSVPGDPSQAAFFVVLGAIHSDAIVTIPNLYGGLERTGFVRVLERMGAHIESSTSGSTISLRSVSSELLGTVVESSEIPSVDEVPVLAIAAAAASGETRFRNVGELRVKESDRLTATAVLVERIGASARIEGDDLIVTGLGSASKFLPFHFHASLDHRMVMSAAIAAAAGNGAELRGVETVATSFPAFFDVLSSLR